MMPGGLQRTAAGSQSGGEARMRAMIGKTVRRLSVTGLASSVLIAAFAMPTIATAQPRPSAAPAVTQLICRPTGQAANTMDPMRIELHAAEGFLLFEFADHTPAEEGKPILFNKDSNFVQWSSPNGDSANMYSLDRVTGEFRYMNGPSQSITIFDCSPDQEQRKF